MNKSHRLILDLTHKEAKQFFLKSESYSSILLPPYFTFSELLTNVDNVLNGKNLSTLINVRKPSSQEGNNYTFYYNKDGKYAWRPIDLIHPAIYVDLLHKVTNEDNWKTIIKCFEEFRKDSRIACMSIPIESLSNEKDKAEGVSLWWKSVEQRSIELALDYEYIAHTDITNCYGSLYTHSIEWALHGKSEAKERSNRNSSDLIGVAIDESIRNMKYGQTNGIPQGSVLMDFIAEMVLGYADVCLSERIKKEGNIEDFQIIRYRDDYRIFTNNPVQGDRIIKIITEIMIELGMEINSSKTIFSDDVIRSSIKPDKLAWLEKQKIAKGLQKRLLIIHGHAKQHPNSGSLLLALSDFYKTLRGQKQIKESVLPMIGITVDIAFHNPKVYPLSAAILSKLIVLLDSCEAREKICQQIIDKFQKLPNVGYMEVWLQRFTRFFNDKIYFKEGLTKVAGLNDHDTEGYKIWNNEWISNRELKLILDKPDIINRNILNNLESEIRLTEIALYIERELDY